METVISAEMRDALGTRVSRRVSYPVSASDIRHWAIAVYWPDPPPEQYLSVSESAVVAPEEFNPFAWAVVESESHPAGHGIGDNDPDRTERQIGIHGPGLTNQLNGAVEVDYAAPVRVGDVITSVVVLADYAEREGRLGHMLMTTSQDTWTNQHGEPVKTTRFTLIRY